jgi:thiamine biosynthesis lipoprotein ApbE
MAFNLPAALRLPVWLRPAPVRRRPAARTRISHYERILGTSLELHLQGDGDRSVAQAEAAALAEIDRLEAIFSVYRPESELRRWLRTLGTAEPVSPELLQVLAAAECWRQATSGAFHPAAAELDRVWAGIEVGEPSPEELAAAVERINGPLWRLDLGAGTATRLVDCAVTLNAIAKGYIVDRACAGAAAVPGIRSVLLNLGGDLRLQGPEQRVIGIADPACDAENAPPVSQIRLQAGAVATSGGYRRGRRIGERWHSHLLDPRTGRPVEGVASASVAAGAAMEADALATAFSVLPPEESLALADGLPDVACLLVLKDGTVRRSRRWAELEIG